MLGNSANSMFYDYAKQQVRVSDLSRVISTFSEHTFPKCKLCNKSKKTDKVEQKTWYHTFDSIRNVNEVSLR